jgi:hypothetical protein
MTTGATTPGQVSCPACGGRVHLNPPRRADEGDVRAWARVLRAREGRRRGVTDGRVYATRREAQSRAAWYRRKLAERRVRTESVTRLHYSFYGRWTWQFVLWREGERPARAVERAHAEKERATAERDAGEGTRSATESAGLSRRGRAS